MSFVSVASWNLMHTNVDFEERMRLVADELGPIDILAAQECFIPDPEFDDGRKISSAELVAKHSGMTIANEVPGVRAKKWSDALIGTAILTRLPVLDTFSVDTTNVYTDKKDCLAYAGALLEAPSGRPILVVSAHLPWGGDGEARRLAHAQAIDSEVRWRLTNYPSDTVAVLAGDFNAYPESDTVRWLTGLGIGTEDRGAQWVDAWAEAGSGPGHTVVVPGNKYAVLMAKTVGIQNPIRIPSRRIDYVLTYGWAYGRPGDPYKAQLLGTIPTADGMHPSDHYGVVAELWDPAR